MSRRVNEEVQKRLSEPEYANYIKTSICLQTTKEGIEAIADCISKQLHITIWVSLHSKFGLPTGRAICRFATVVYARRLPCKWKFDCCRACSLYIEELSKYCREDFSFTQASWANTDYTGWSDVDRHWELAKLFMPTTSDKNPKQPAETEILGILHFIYNCTIGGQYVSSPDYIKGVLQARNAVAHNSSMTFKDSEFKLFTDSMLQLLYDMKNHQVTDDLVIAIHDIEKVRDATFHLNALMEYSVIENQMERLEQIIDHQRRNVEKLHETCDQLEDIDMADYRMSDENFHKRLTDEQAKLVASICERVNSKSTNDARSDLLSTMSKRVEIIKANAHAFSYQRFEN